MIFDVSTINLILNIAAGITISIGLLMFILGIAAHHGINADEKRKARIDRGGVAIILGIAIPFAKLLFCES
jgi:hypothetical protein